MTISRTEMQMIEKKLDNMEIEAKKLRALLVPMVKISRREREEIKKIKDEMAKGDKIGGRQLIKKMREKTG
jgi:exopolyphosphatase/pppGpp-phosphohydrolase